MALHVESIAGVVVAAIVFFYLQQRWSKPPSSLQHPWGQAYLAYLPRFVSGVLFDKYALALIDASNEEHQDNAYKLARHDVDLVILPPKVLDELAGLSTDVASNILALVYDLVGGWCGLSMLKESSLHMRVTHRRITPNLGKLQAEVENEVSESIAELFPSKEDGKWVTMNPYSTMMTVAARVFSRVVVGRQYCREERWLNFAINFTENVFESLLTMRHFPPWMYPILRYTLPSVQRSIDLIKEAEDYLVPKFQDLLNNSKITGASIDDENVEPNAMAWIANMATEDERDPVTMVHALILLALGSIHTSLFAEVNLLYDLIANPKCMDIVREEYQEVLSDGDWNVESYHRMYKLDSMLRESQRLAPPFLIGLRRVMKQQHIFANGIVAPQGSYVCIPTYTMLRDVDGHRSRTFDGLRSYNLKLDRDDLKSTRHKFTTTDASALGFGHGRTACPGRFLAELALKIVFVKLITEYDFKFADGGTERPKSKITHDVVYPDSNVTVLVRKRKSAACHF